MGLFSAIFGGNTKQSSTTAVDVLTQLDVSVEPQIAVEVEVDTAPIGDALARFVDSSEAQAATLAAGVVSGAGLQAAGLAAVGEALATAERDAAVLDAAGRASIGQGLQDFSETVKLIGLALAGVTLIRALG
jgi:hypothetical protein